MASPKIDPPHPLGATARGLPPLSTSVAQRLHPGNHELPGARDRSVMSRRQRLALREFEAGTVEFCISPLSPRRPRPCNDTW